MEESLEKELDRREKEAKTELQWKMSLWMDRVMKSKNISNSENDGLAWDFCENIEKYVKEMAKIQDERVVRGSNQMH